MNNQMMMNNMNNPMMMNNMNNPMMMNNMNNQMMMNNNNINQMGNDKMKDLLEELDYMRNKVNLYEKRIKTLEERIKEKDSEIINLKNRLSTNFNYNAGMGGMQPIYYNNNPMMMGMMGQMNCMNSPPNPTNNSNKMEKEKISKNLIVNFIFDGDKIAVQGNSDMTIQNLIRNFKVKLGIDNFSGDYFIGSREIDKDSTEKLAQSGISDDDEIYVFEQNDKNQKEKLSKMLSHKHDNITITFNASNGSKVLATVCHYTKISKILKAYSEKLLIGKIELGKDIMFLYNGAILDIHDNRTIEEFSGGRDSIAITVYDIKNIIGA